MKKIISVLLITVLCCAFLFSCGNTEDTGKLYLVKQTMTDKTGTTTVEFLYNQDYQVVKHKTTAGGISDTESNIGYDENGFQNYQKNVSKSGLVSEIFFTNDANGRNLEMRTVQTYNGTKTEIIITLIVLAVVAILALLYAIAGVVTVVQKIKKRSESKAKDNHTEVSK